MLEGIFSRLCLWRPLQVRLGRARHVFLEFFFFFFKCSLNSLAHSPSLFLSSSHPHLSQILQTLRSVWLKQSGKVQTESKTSNQSISINFNISSLGPHKDSLNSRLISDLAP